MASERMKKIKECEVHWRIMKKRNPKSIRYGSLGPIWMNIVRVQLMCVRHGLQLNSGDDDDGTQAHVLEASTSMQAIVGCECIECALDKEWRQWRRRTIALRAHHIWMKSNQSHAHTMHAWKGIEATRRACWKRKQMKKKHTHSQTLKINTVEIGADRAIRFSKWHRKENGERLRHASRKLHSDRRHISVDELLFLWLLLMCLRGHSRNWMLINNWLRWIVNVP